MNINLIILLITGGLLYNTYHENFLFKSFDKYKNLMSNKISFIELMRNSPLVGVELDIDRKIDKEREINL